MVSEAACSSGSTGASITVPTPIALSLSAAANRTGAMSRVTLC